MTVYSEKDCDAMSLPIILQHLLYVNAKFINFIIS